MSSGNHDGRSAMYFKSLDGSMLVWGCERSPLAVVVGAAMAPLPSSFIALTRGLWGKAGFGLAVMLAVLFLSVYALREMAKADPMMCRTYLRNRRYKRSYPARSTPFCEK